MKKPIGTRFRRHPVTAFILEERQNTITPIMDKALRVRDDKGTWWYHLKKTGVFMKPPETTAILSNKFGTADSRSIVFFYSPKPELYVPIRFEKGLGKIIDEEVLYWYCLQLQESYELYRPDEFWKVMTPIILGGILVFGFLAVALIIKSEVAQPLLQVVELLKQVLSGYRPT